MTAAVETGGAHAEVAARHGVSVGALRSWLYKLREQRGRAAASPTLRPLPVAMQAETAFDLKVDAGGYRLRFVSAA